MTDSIENGRIVKVYHLFFPYDRSGALFPDEAALARAVPTFYRAVLKPSEAALRSRVAIVRAKREDWWGLMHPRTGSFALDERPRLVSKFFGAEGSFILDETAQYLPSTGHVWLPKRTAGIGDEADEGWSQDVAHAASLEVLRAYTGLVNSAAFTRLVSFRSVTIAGGQYDLSSRFLAPVPLPDLWEKAENPLYAEHVRALAQATRDAAAGRAVAGAEIDRLVAYLYGVSELAEV